MVVKEVFNVVFLFFRINQCNLFCSALNKPFDNQALPIRTKRLYNLEQFESAVSNLEYRAMKRVKRAVTIDTPDRINRNEMFYVVGSVLILKEIKGNIIPVSECIHVFATHPREE